MVLQNYMMCLAVITKKKEIILKGGKSVKMDYLEVQGTGGKLHNNSSNPSEDMIDLANSGTTLRIMTSLAALSDNEVIFTGDDSLKTRPMGALLDALKPLGVKTVSKLGNDKAPIKIMPGYQGGESEILGSISSQFISSILISAPLTEKGVFLEVFPQFVSKPYVDMTISIMKTFGVGVDEEETGLHEVCTSCEERCLGVDYSVSPQKYMSCDYVVEGDYSSASYLLAAGDKLIIDILKDMGVDITVFNDYLIVKSDGNLKAVSEVDLSNAPDLLLTVAVLAACACGDTKITGVHHARLKETDRIDTTCRELEKLGCVLEENDDGMIIKGNTIHGGTVSSHNDHRLAMAFSLLGLKHDVEVEDGECFDVSFPNFIEAMAEIGVELELK